MIAPVYQHAIVAKPDYAMISVGLPAGAMIKVESAAMATMSPNLIMKTKMRGGLGRVFTGESLFINEFVAQDGEGRISIAPGCPGDIEYQRIQGKAIFLQSSAYLASSPGVVLETKWQGFVKGFFAGKGFFLVRCSGDGDLWFNSYGALIPIDVKDEYIIDTGYVVAFTDTLQYEVGRVGGYKSLFFSGEGLICRFRGQGTVWMQSRTAPAFAAWANAFRPVQKSNS